MTPAWVARLPLSEAAAAGRMRTERGLQAAEDRDHLWLHSTETSEVVAFHQNLPEASFFHVLSDRQLVPDGHLVPTGRLPELDWRPISEVLKIDVPVAKHAGRPQIRTTLRLVPSSVATTPNVLVTTLESWATYAVTAPQVRLDRWRFAVSTEGDAVIRGEPLPPLPGRLYVEQSGLACAAGWKWSPIVDASVLREMMGVQTDDLAMLDGTDVKRAEKSPNRSATAPLSPLSSESIPDDVIGGRGVGGEENKGDFESVPPHPDPLPHSHAFQAADTHCEGEGDVVTSFDDLQRRHDRLCVTIIEGRDFAQATRSAVRASKQEG